MLLYNVTVGVDKEIEEEWLRYMKEKHIRDILDTGLFVDYKMYKVLHDQEEGTISYSVQYFARTIEDIKKYLEVFAPALVEQHRRRFQNRHVAFMTLLDEV
ncbi:MAG TPA: DUF4286 family protein [Chryseosolibacter sp.]